MWTQMQPSAVDYRNKSGQNVLSYWAKHERTISNKERDIVTGDQFQGLIQLTRWKEHIAFVIPLTVLGALLALQAAGESAVIDWRLIAVTLGNFFVVAYAFMINDIEDAPDDAREADRAARNPVTSGRISARLGYAACAVVAVITLFLFWLGGSNVLIIGSITLLLSHLYSWRPVRLKAWPITDVLSHSLMLSGLLMVAGYFIYHSQPGPVWFVAAGVTLVSVYGQLYNQIRDYDMDKAAGLHNTALILGEANARRASYLAIGLAGLSLVTAVLQGVFPLWLGAALVISIIISSFIRTENDMRGTKATDFSGKMQWQGMVAVDLTVAAWLSWVLLNQLIL